MKDIDFFKKCIWWIKLQGNDPNNIHEKLYGQ